MKAKWNTVRKWDATKGEKVFEQLLEEHGYAIKGYREYQTKTDFLIEKDGIELEYCIYHTEDIAKSSTAKLCFKNFENYYTQKVQLLELQRQVAEREAADGKN